MVPEADSDQAARFAETPRNGNVFWARQRIPGRVIVDENHPVGGFSNRLHEDIARHNQSHFLRPDARDAPQGGRSETLDVLKDGSWGAQIIDELKPLPSEPVIDKPGKGAFHATDLEAVLKTQGIQSLVVTGVTTEVCVQTTVREANDRGYECLVLEDCVASYFSEFQAAAIKMIKAQGGIFGWVSTSEKLLRVLEELR